MMPLVGIPASRNPIPYYPQYPGTRVAQQISTGLFVPAITRTVFACTAVLHKSRCMVPGYPGMHIRTCDTRASQWSGRAACCATSTTTGALATSHAADVSEWHTLATLQLLSCAILRPDRRRFGESLLSFQAMTLCSNLRVWWRLRHSVRNRHRWSQRHLWFNNTVPPLMVRLSASPESFTDCSSAHHLLQQ